MPNLYKNKVVYGNTTLIDISDTTAAASDVAAGKYFYLASGQKVEGTSSVVPTASSYTLLGSHEFTVNTTSTSATSVGTFTVPETVWTKDKVVYIRIKDKAGKRAGYFYGTDNWFINLNAQINSTADFAFGLRYVRRYSTSSVFEQYYSSGTTGYGVYARSIAKDGTIKVYSRYSSSYTLTISGTYIVEVYTLDLPGGTSPFA